MRTIKVRLCILGIMWKEVQVDYTQVNEEYRFSQGIPINNIPTELKPMFTLMEFRFKPVNIIGEKNEEIAIFDLMTIEYPEIEQAKDIQRVNMILLDEAHKMRIDNTLLMKQRDSQDIQLEELLRGTLKYKKLYKKYKKQYTETLTLLTKIKYKVQRMKNGKKKGKGVHP